MGVGGGMDYELWTKDGRYEDAGNYNRGLVAACWGIPEDLVHWGLGAYKYQQQHGKLVLLFGYLINNDFVSGLELATTGCLEAASAPSKEDAPWAQYPYGDKLRGQKLAKQGYQYFIAHRKELLANCPKAPNYDPMVTDWFNSLDKKAPRRLRR